MDKHLVIFPMKSQISIGYLLEMYMYSLENANACSKAKKVDGSREWRPKVILRWAQKIGVERIKGQTLKVYRGCPKELWPPQF